MIQWKLPSWQSQGFCRGQSSSRSFETVHLPRRHRTAHRTAQSCKADRAIVNYGKSAIGSFDVAYFAVGTKLATTSSLARTLIAIPTVIAVFAIVAARSEKLLIGADERFVRYASVQVEWHTLRTQLQGWRKWKLPQWKAYYSVDCYVTARSVNEIARVDFCEFIYLQWNQLGTRILKSLWKSGARKRLKHILRVMLFWRYVTEYLSDCSPRFISHLVEIRVCDCKRRYRRTDVALPDWWRPTRLPLLERGQGEGAGLRQPVQGTEECMQRLWLARRMGWWSSDLLGLLCWLVVSITAECQRSRK